MRELNEGVKRIYTDMKSYFLEPPIFSEPNKNTVQLVLKNNIAARSVRKMEGLRSISIQEWAELKPLAREIIYYIANIDHCTTKQLLEATGKSRQAILRHLKTLLKENGGPVEEHGSSPSDPTRVFFYRIAGCCQLTVNLPSTYCELDFCAESIENGDISGAEGRI